MAFRRLIFILALVISLVAAAATVSGCSAAPVLGRDYIMSSYDVVCVLAADGSATMTETFDFTVVHRSQNFEFDIEYADAGGLTIRQVAVASGSDSQGNEQFVEIQPVKAENKAGATRYEASDDGSSMHVEVTIPTEAGAVRRIKLTYVLSRVVERNSDNAFLNKVFFNSSSVSRAQTSKLTLMLPSAAADVAVWALPVSETEYAESRPTPDSVVLTGQAAEGQAEMDLFLLMPDDFFTDAPSAAVNRSWDTLVAKARQTDLLIKEDALTRSAVHRLVLTLLILSVLLVGVIFWLYDRECAASFHHRYWQNVPEQCPPAVLTILTRRGKPGRLMLSTLLDLVRRGELRMQGNVFTLPPAEEREYNGFAAFEIFLVQWLFDHVVGGHTLSTADIRRYARDKATSGELHTYYRQFRHMIDEEIERRGLLDERRMHRGRQAAVIASLLYLVLTGAFIAILGNFFSLFLLIPAAFLGFYGWKLRRLTPAGRDLQAMTLALQRTVCDIDGSLEISEPDFFADMLPLAEALGIAGKHIRNLLGAAAHQEDPYQAFNLAGFGIRLSARSWQDQVNALDEDIRIMESMLTASLLLSIHE